jgi:hypothetical protein
MQNTKTQKQKSLDHSRQQQAACRDALERDGWDEFTALGLSDWLHEELLIEKEMELCPLT